jgi:2-haloacid dehalogenase
MTQQPIIVFDVNETLLDLETLRATFERIFNDPATMRLWFAGLITYSEALTLAGVYVPFTDIGAAVLRMLAATRSIEIGDADTAELTDRFASMPPHSEVPAALRRLREHDFRLFTLTDNTLEISGRQLEKAGVIDVFERRFSVDETVRRHKPAPEAYHSVAGARRRAGRHLSDRVPRLGHARCSRRRMAGRADPSRGQRPTRRRPAADVHRGRPRSDRRSAHRALSGHL